MTKTSSLQAKSGTLFANSPIKAPLGLTLYLIVLSNVGEKLAIYLCKIFNSCTRLEYFPNQWKIADIIMIPKPKKTQKSQPTTDLYLSWTRWVNYTRNSYSPDLKITSWLLSPARHWNSTSQLHRQHNKYYEQKAKNSSNSSWYLKSIW